nr:uncharacterized protein LOC127316138 [Lolium perenne]
MPPLSRASASRRRGSSWQPRRMAASSSSSGSASRSAPSWAPVEMEPPSPPSNRACNGGGIVIREPSTTRGRLLPNREPDTSGERKRKPAKVKVEEANDAEDAAILEAVMARSLQDLVPADNAMPLDQACTWSREQWEKEEAERQAQLLEDVARYRRPATPPSGVPVPVIDLEESDDDCHPSPCPRHCATPPQAPPLRAAPPLRDAAPPRAPPLRDAGPPQALRTTPPPAAAPARCPASVLLQQLGGQTPDVLCDTAPAPCRDRRKARTSSFNCRLVPACAIF